MMSVVFKQNRRLSLGLFSSIGRCPFTVVLLVGILLAGLLTGAWHHRVAPDVIDALGFSVSRIWDGRAWTYVIATFLTDRPLMFWGILIFTPFVVGGYEFWAGSRRALVVFWLGGLVALVSAALAGAGVSHLAGIGDGARFVRVADVGMSAGGFACLGGLVLRLGQRGRPIALTVIYAGILVKMAIMLELSSDLVHMVALPIGLFLSNYLARPWAKADAS